MLWIYLLQHSTRQTAILYLAYMKFYCRSRIHAFPDNIRCFFNMYARVYICKHWQYAPWENYAMLCMSVGMVSAVAIEKLFIIYSEVEAKCPPCGLNCKLKNSIKKKIFFSLKIITEFYFLWELLFWRLLIYYLYKFNI